MTPHAAGSALAGPGIDKSPTRHRPRLHRILEPPIILDQDSKKFPGIRLAKMLPSASILPGAQHPGGTLPTLSICASLPRIAGPPGSHGGRYPASSYLNRDAAASSWKPTRPHRTGAASDSSLYVARRECAAAPIGCVPLPRGHRRRVWLWARPHGSPCDGATSSVQRLLRLNRPSSAGGTADRLTRSNRRGTDPYARWCGGGGAARLPPIPLSAQKCELINFYPFPGQWSVASRPHECSACRLVIDETLIGPERAKLL